MPVSFLNKIKKKKFFKNIVCTSIGVLALWKEKKKPERTKLQGEKI
jgi:hypothetical protein